MIWLLAGALLIAAALFVAVPLLRREVDSADDVERDSVGADAVVRAVYRDRLNELEAEAAAGRLDPDVREQVFEELGAALLDDYRAFEAAPADGGPSGRAAGRAAGWLLALLLPIGGLGIYWVIGEPSASVVQGASAILQLDPERDRADIEAWRKRLERRVSLQPADAQSWFLLGTAGLQLGDFRPAAEAFAQAAEIAGPDPVIDIYWLQASYLAQGGELDPRSREIADRILARQPSHPLVLELFAIDAFRKGGFREAVTYLNRALGNDLSDGQLETLLAGLQAARDRLEPLLPRVDVAVSAAPGAPPDAVLFVIARPPGGGVPYAVVRRPARLMPLSVQLDDTASMNPAMPLSIAPAFEVVVRLSRSGNPAPQPGDWEWRSAPLETADLATPVDLAVTLAPPEAATATAPPANASSGT